MNGLQYKPFMESNKSETTGKIFRAMNEKRPKRLLSPINIAVNGNNSSNNNVVVDDVDDLSFKDENDLLLVDGRKRALVFTKNILLSNGVFHPLTFLQSLPQFENIFIYATEADDSTSTKKLLQPVSMSPKNDTTQKEIPSKCSSFVSDGSSQPNSPAEFSATSHLSNIAAESCMNQPKKKKQKVTKCPKLQSNNSSSNEIFASYCSPGSSIELKSASLTIPADLLVSPTGNKKIGELEIDDNHKYSIGSTLNCGEFRSVCDRCTQMKVRCVKSNPFDPCVRCLKRGKCCAYSRKKTKKEVGFGNENMQTTKFVANEIQKENTSIILERNS